MGQNIDFIEIKKKYKNKGTIKNGDVLTVEQLKIGSTVALFALTVNT